MSVILWSFEHGRLVAKDKAGRWLWSARAEDDVGLELVRLLNQAPRLSAALMASAIQGSDTAYPASS